MRRAALIVLGALGGCADEAQRPAFTDVAIALPADTVALPAAPGTDIVASNCLACHSAEMITTQPRLTRAQWQAIVEKMQKTYKAPIAPRDVAVIVETLDALNATLAQDAKKARRNLGIPAGILR